MTPDRVHLDPDDPLDPAVWACSACGHLWESLAAARACEESDDVRD